MQFRTVMACLLAVPGLLTMNGVSAQKEAKKEETPAFTFMDLKYVHRYTTEVLHEYTPIGQVDLKHWTDMVTINYYRNAKSGEDLAKAANSVLETYKANKAMVVKTSSVPRTKTKPAEHLIVVLFPQPEFIEAAFARFKMQGAIGTSIVYSHRIYGAKVGNDMSAWLKKNGPAIEKSLMAWNGMPQFRSVPK